MHSNGLFRWRFWGFAVLVLLALSGCSSNGNVNEKVATSPTPNPTISNTSNASENPTNVGAAKVLCT